MILPISVIDDNSVDSPVKVKTTKACIEKVKIVDKICKLVKSTL